VAIAMFVEKGLRVQPEDFLPFVGTGEDIRPRSAWRRFQMTHRRNFAISAVLEKEAKELLTVTLHTSLSWALGDVCGQPSGWCLNLV
jgi:hypothetical protein